MKIKHTLNLSIGNKIKYLVKINFPWKEEYFTSSERLIYSLQYSKWHLLYMLRFFEYFNKLLIHNEQ